MNMLQFHVNNDLDILYVLFFVMMLGVILSNYSIYKMYTLLTRSHKWKLFGFTNWGMRLERIFIKKIIRAKDKKTKLIYGKVLGLYLLGLAIMSGAMILICSF